MLKRFRLVAVLVCFAAALSLAGCAGGDSASAPSGAAGPEALYPVPDGGLRLELLKTPVPVADIAFTDVHGTTFRTADLKGKVTLVNYWATWCGPCRMEIPDLVKLQAQYPDHLRVIGVSIDEGPIDEVRRFMQEYGMNYPVVMMNPEINRQFPGVRAIPTSFMIDTAARIVASHVGLVSPTIVEQELRHLVSLSTNATVELVEETKEERLLNAAHATEVPGVDLTTLTAGQKEAALRRLNEEPCTCGCQLTVAQCRINDPACAVSLPIAQDIVSQVQGT